MSAIKAGLFSKVNKFLSSLDMPLTHTGTPAEYHFLHDSSTN